MSSPATANLVMRFAGALQSWGGPSQYSRRETRMEPTKSGVVGLLAAALGRKRHQAVSDLAALRMGIRTDQPGRLLRDYHTVADYRGRPLLSANVNKQGRQQPRDTTRPLETYRYYLQDAVFIAVVSGDRTLIEQAGAALQQPAFPLALGRRGCPPSRPLRVEVQTVADDLTAALADIPWQAGKAYRATRPGSSITLPITVDDPAGTETLHDVPVTFDLSAPGQRASRRVRRSWVTIHVGETTESDAPTTTHDPFALLGW